MEYNEEVVHTEENCLKPLKGGQGSRLITKEMRREQFKKRYHSNSGTHGGDEGKTAADSNSVIADINIVSHSNADV
jgi:hypothetical protein